MDQIRQTEMQEPKQTPIFSPKFYAVVLPLSVLIIFGLITWNVCFPIENAKDIRTNTESIKVLDMKFSTQIKSISENIVDMKILLGEIRNYQLAQAGRGNTQRPDYKYIMPEEKQ